MPIDGILLARLDIIRPINLAGRSLKLLPYLMGVNSDMKKILSIVIILFLLLFSNWCLNVKNSRYILKQDDITVEKSITPKPDKQLEIKVEWDLIPEIRVNYPMDLYYHPYLVIVPPDTKDWYHSNSSSNGYILSSLPHEVIANVLNKIPDFDWEKNSQIRFGWDVSIKSFEQGSIDILFKQLRESVTMEPFKVYFVYYDPIAKKGWVKLI
jgi:hypothetical protein